ncbi:unnamed protein product [Pieris macdunnoughi]|uniref:Uncharacterized protein n=1 Tax=Pieris macdunnoughi TaxID=345717 RepID=A0A821LWY0_9NEOP|nr:unnamed protein product [Pieris macdunnoughi]
MSLGPAKRALILSIVGVSGSEVRVPPAAIYGAARAVNSNGLSHRGARPAPPAPLSHPRPVVPTPQRPINSRLNFNFISYRYCSKKIKCERTAERFTRVYWQFCSRYGNATMQINSKKPATGQHCPSLLFGSRGIAFIPLMEK